MTIFGGKASITEFVLTIGDADTGGDGNTAKGNRDALNQLNWDNVLLRRKAKAVGDGDGFRLWLWLRFRLRCVVIARIVRLIVVARGGLTRRWVVRLGLGGGYWCAAPCAYVV